MHQKVFNPNYVFAILILLSVIVFNLVGCSSEQSYNDKSKTYKQETVKVSPLSVKKMEAPFNASEPDVKVPEFYTSKTLPDKYVVITTVSAKQVRNTFEDYNFSKKYSELCYASYNDLTQVTSTERDVHLKHLDILKERSEQLDRTEQMLDDERSEMKKTKLFHYVVEGGLLALLVLAL